MSLFVIRCAFDHCPEVYGSTDYTNARRTLLARGWDVYPQAREGRGLGLCPTHRETR